ncbi:MAG: carboxypeptidase-like regulatory domain-containing protein [Bacteroidetes bacterium]|jgi:hypothetical protein|nr:carboxypeptidase-like regulatory domain-containing protein [Bacteroidota bacterium]
MKNAISILFIFLFVGNIFAATPKTDIMFVNGTVCDKKNHESLAGVEVRVKGTNIVVYTDFDGNFFLPELPRGNYQLDFNYITYSSSQLVTDNCDHCSTLTVEMNQQ